jgi:hypothetical protein
MPWKLVIVDPEVHRRAGDSDFGRRPPLAARAARQISTIATSDRVEIWPLARAGTLPPSRPLNHRHGFQGFATLSLHPAENYYGDENAGVNAAVARATRLRNFCG